MATITILIRYNPQQLLSRAECRSFVINAMHGVIGKPATLTFDAV